jgi:hypothetical protein
MCQIESKDAYRTDLIIFAGKGWLVIVQCTLHILQSYIIVNHGEKTCSNVTHAQLHSLPNIPPSVQFHQLTNTAELLVST